MERRTRLEETTRRGSETPTERWEYLTRFVYADLSRPGVPEFMQSNWPDWHPAMYAPETMMLELNKLGAQGWEVINVEPVPQVGSNEDIRFNGDTHTWSNAYFCVLKRRIS